MVNILIKLILLISLSARFSKAYLENDGWFSFQMYHALDSRDSKWTYRGNVTIPSLTVGLASINQVPLTKDNQLKLGKLAEENEFYRLRTVVTYPDGSTTDLLTSSKACGLVKSNLNDVLWVSIDTSGSVLAITQTVSGSMEKCKNFDVNSANLKEFSTDVLIKQMELGPIPDTASFIQKMEREREARERGETRDNRGFFAKYWMYFIPLLLFIIFSGAANPEAGASAAGGGSGR